MAQKLRKHLNNIYLTLALIVFGILLKLNRKFLIIDFNGRWIIEHFVAFFFFPILLVTILFIIADCLVKDDKSLIWAKYWIVLVAISLNVFLSFFWEIDVQHFKTWYQIVIDFIATILSFSYLWKYYDKGKFIK